MTIDIAFKIFEKLTGKQEAGWVSQVRNSREET